MDRSRTVQKPLNARTTHRHHFYDTLNEIAASTHKHNIIQHSTEDHSLSGRTFTVQSKTFTNFCSCSYMGLEHHPTLVQGCVSAVERYGTQFSSSRAYLSLGLYQELEALLGKLFGNPTLASATTTLGHISVLSVLVHNEDAVIIDYQAHASLQMTTKLLKARGIPLHVIPHNDLDTLEQKIQQLKVKHRHIWYIADGVYSMYGDFAPLNQLQQLLDTHEQLYLYLDDAHGMSWTGKHGSGYVLSQIDHHSKMILSTSLNKAFSCAGGALVFPNEDWLKKVKNCGDTFIFSGPIQPPMLGAAIASAKLHLSQEIYGYQQELTELIEHANQGIQSRDLPTVMPTSSPVFFIPLGLPRVTYNFVKRMFDEHFFVNVAAFPATPMHKGGMRFTIHRHLQKSDIDNLLEKVRYHYPLALKEENVSCEAVARAFGIPDFELNPVDHFSASVQNKLFDASALKLTLKKSINAVAAEEWDDLMAERGNFTHDNLQLIEKLFSKDTVEPENRWDFYYVLVRDAQGEVVLATFYTVALIKEDMFAPASASKKIEVIRSKDPHYLVSNAITLGCMITKGEHLYLDRSHPDWKNALALCVEQIQKTVSQCNASQVLLREFPMGQDEILKQVMLDLGFVEYRVLDNCLIDDLTWSDHDAYMQRLNGKYRYNVRKEILAYEDLFVVTADKSLSEEEMRHGYALYCEVHQRAFELNVFRLPFSFFEAICRHPDYDVIRLYLKDEHGEKDAQPVAIMYSFAKGSAYRALIVGLDYNYVYSHNTYKQILYQTVQRARQLNYSLLDLAYTAVLEKKKIGARPHPVCAYVQTMDHYHHAVIESMTDESSSA